MRALIYLMLMGSLMAQNLQSGKRQQPRMTTPFRLDYYHLPMKDTSDIKGKVVVSFFVDEDGEVTNPEIVDTFNTILNDAIINRVLSIKFEPAKQNGRPVRVRYSLPILFK